MSDRTDEYPLIGKTKADRLERQALSWPGTPMEKKREIMDRMAQLAVSPATGPREAVSAAKVLLQADKLSFDVEKNLPPRPLNPVHGNVPELNLSMADVHRVMELDLSSAEVHRIMELGYWPDDIPGRPENDAENESSHDGRRLASPHRNSSSAPGIESWG